MNEKRPLILISNDDGYHARGINCLMDMLSDMADLLVCAPESARSGFSCAFSATTPLRLKLRRRREGVDVWSCNGTPVDCVKLALDSLCDGRKPDMVLRDGLPTGVCLNVNFPLVDEFRGVRVCRMAKGTWGNECVRMTHPHGYDYFWMTGEYTNDEPEAEDTDNWALTHGYVAITPTTIDVTAYDMIGKMKDWTF